MAPFSARFGIRTNDPEVVPRLRAIMVPEGWRVRTRGDAVCDMLLSLRVGPPGGARGRRNYHLVYWSADTLARTLDLDEALAVLARQFHFLASLTARNHTVVQAAVVGWKGRAVVLAGEPGGGRSTLARALVEQGAELYSDRFLVLDGEGQATPYPAPVRTETGWVRPRKLGWRADLGPAPLGAVVLTDYREGGRFRPRRLTPGEGVHRLLSLSERSIEAADLQRLARAVEPVPCWKGSRGEADQTARTLLRRLEW